LRVAYVAEKHQGLALAEELAAELKGKRVFLPRSDLASADLPDALRRFGAHVAEVVAYRTCSTSEPDSLSASSFLSAHPRALLFFSPSAVRAFLAQEQGRELLTSISLNSDRIAVVAIGPVTATALREAGIRNIVQAPNPTVPAVVEALEQFFSSTEPEPRSL
jgi:uroporphyrinogen III methyltransferase/synthase